MDDGSWGIAAPQAHGPEGCSLSATRLNVSASGQHEASAMRTRLAVSMMRPAIFSRRRRIVANSVCRSGFQLGTAAHSSSCLPSRRLSEFRAVLTQNTRIVKCSCGCIEIATSNAAFPIARP
jgi:hypothetical protein